MNEYQRSRGTAVFIITIGNRLNVSDQLLEPAVLPSEKNDGTY